MEHDLGGGWGVPFQMNDQLEALIRVSLVGAFSFLDPSRSRFFCGFKIGRA